MACQSTNPFGGIMTTGCGRETSGISIQEFADKKLVRVAAIDETA